MQTAVEWLFQKLPTIDKYDPYYSDIIKQAKEMEKQQIIDAHLIGLIRSLEMEATKQATEYFDETYGSKGSDDHIVDTNKVIFNQELFNYFSQEFNINLLGTEIQDIIDIVKKQISSQTEISDEEIEELLFHHSNEYAIGFKDAINWYREQLRQRK